MEIIPQGSLEKRALVAIENLQEKLDSVERLFREPIAIIGIGCRFPSGADNPQRYWELLRDGVDAITHGRKNRMQQWGGYLDQVDGFDAPFFDISSLEASQMDPQQRVFLQVAWEALENAGQTRDNLEESATGVFLGIYNSDYAFLHETQSASHN